MSRITITQTGGTLSVDETQVAVVVIVGEQGPAGVGAESALLIANNLSEMNTPEKKLAARTNIGAGTANPQTFAESRWQWTDLVAAAQAAPFGSVAINSGTTASPGTAEQIPGIFGLARLRSSTTTNSGWRINTSQPLRGASGFAFRAIMGIFTGISGLVRVGFHDTASVTDATNGVYLEIADGVATLKAATNSARTSSASTFTMGNGTLYVIDIDYTSDTTAEAKFYDLAGVLQATLTVASNVPNANNRTFNAGLVATRPGATAVDIAAVDYLGFGPVRPPYARLFPL